MCYSGKCKYEDHMGECQVSGIRWKLNGEQCPDDAMCVINDLQIAEVEENK